MKKALLIAHFICALIGVVLLAIGLEGIGTILLIIAAILVLVIAILLEMELIAYLDEYM